MKFTIFQLHWDDCLLHCDWGSVVTILEISFRPLSGRLCPEHSLHSLSEWPTKYFGCGRMMSSFFLLVLSFFVELFWRVWYLQYPMIHILMMKNNTVIPRFTCLPRQPKNNINRNLHYYKHLFCFMRFYVPRTSLAFPLWMAMEIFWMWNDIDFFIPLLLSFFSNCFDEFEAFSFPWFICFIS